MEYCGYQKMLKQILHNEFCRYLLSGVSITFVNFFLFYLFLNFNWLYQTANLTAIILAKLYGFFINKYFVYRSKKANFVSEMWRYILVRGATGVLDYFLVLFLVEILFLYPLTAKIVTLILVVILNYILGKIFVFARGKNEKT